MVAYLLGPFHVTAQNGHELHTLAQYLARRLSAALLLLGGMDALTWSLDSQEVQGLTPSGHVTIAVRFHATVP